MADLLARAGRLPLGRAHIGRRAATWPSEQVSEILTALPLAALLVAADERVIEANAGGADPVRAPVIVGRHHGFALRQPEVLRRDSAALLRRESLWCDRFCRAPAMRWCTASPFRQSGTGALCLFQDISDQEQSEQMRRDFVANVSHELRTPLTSLLGFIETLRGPARDDVVARARFLGIMASEAERMNRLVRDLLQLSRVEAQERQRPATSARSGSPRAAGGAKPATAGRIVGGGFGDQRAGRAGQPVFVDPDQMMQVVTNLVENAIKYGASGKVGRGAADAGRGAYAARRCGWM